VSLLMLQAVVVHFVTYEARSHQSRSIGEWQNTRLIAMLLSCVVGFIAIRPKHPTNTTGGIRYDEIGRNKIERYRAPTAAAARHLRNLEKAVVQAWQQQAARRRGDVETCKRHGTLQPLQAGLKLCVPRVACYHAGKETGSEVKMSGSTSSKVMPKPVSSTVCPNAAAPVEHVPSFVNCSSWHPHKLTSVAPAAPFAKGCSTLPHAHPTQTQVRSRRTPPARPAPMLPATAQHVPPPPRVRRFDT